jgi:hypothetical protein
MFTTTIKVGGGFDVDYTVLDIGGANYLGPVSGVLRSRIPTDMRNGDGATWSLSGGPSAGFKCALELNYTPSSRVFGRNIQLGFGLPAGLAPVNGAVGASNTFELKDFYSSDEQGQKEP